MPRYQYQCKNVQCLRSQEVVFRIAQQPSELRCPYCLDGTMKQQITVPYLTTRPHYLREENQLYPGLDKADRHAQIASDMAAHEERARNDRTQQTDKGPDPYEGVTDFFQYQEAGYEIPSIKDLVKEGVIK